MTSRPSGYIKNLKLEKKIVNDVRNGFTFRLCVSEETDDKSDEEDGSLTLIIALSAVIGKTSKNLCKTSSTPLQK